MFSIIVMVAIITSFMAPLGLRLTMRMVRMTDEEQRRIRAAESKGVFDPEKVRLLLPAARGGSTLAAARLALGVARRSESPVEVLHVDEVSTWWDRMLRMAQPLTRAQTAPAVAEEHLDRIKELADGAKPPRMRRIASRHVAATILEEAKKGYDLVVIGASSRGPAVGDVVEAVVEGAPCHVAIVRAGPEGAFRRVLVPIDGSTVSRVAAELAVRYAESVGAALTLAITTERRPQVADYVDRAVERPLFEAAAATPEADLERVSSVFRASALKPDILHLEYDPTHSALADEVASGRFDLIVLGAENRAIQHRLFFGYENERLLESTNVAVAIVVPYLGRRG